jgi:pentatricopeptide repeat protein
MLLPDGSSSSAKSKQPSPAAFKAVIKAYVDSKDFGKALQLIADMEEVHGGTRAVSVYGGLSFLPIDELKREEDIAAVFTQLKARKVGSC